MKSPANYFPESQIDLKNFHLNRINEPQYRHMWFLLFWPIFGLRYLLIENVNPIGEYHLIHCPLDALIPFQELFLISYGLWFVGIIGIIRLLMIPMIVWLYCEKQDYAKQRELSVL